MKFLLMVVFLLMFGLISCSVDSPADISGVVIPEQPVFPGDENSGENKEEDESKDDNGDHADKEEDSNNNEESDQNMTVKALKITIGSVAFTATLLDNPTADAFKKLMPLTVNMGELNGNEKYYNLPGRLPVSASAPETIRAGDLMVWGSNCVVLFYETFSSSYSYTKFATIDDPSGLKEALGTGSVMITFELKR